MSQFNPSQALQSALQQHQAGRPAEAAQIYQMVLEREPNNADALHLLGVAYGQLGRVDQGVELIARAISLNPTVAAFHNNLGNNLKLRGQIDDAIAAYRAALKLNAGYPDAHNNLGIVLAMRGRFAEAIASYKTAIELRPEYADALNNMGIALAETGKLSEAIDALRRALKLQPEYPEGLNNLGNILRRSGKLEKAITAYRHALKLRREYPEALNNLGVALIEQGQIDEATEMIRKALALQNNYPDAWSNLGIALAEKGKIDDAIGAYEHALRLMPNYPRALNNLGNAQRIAGRLEQAIASLSQALRLAPNYPEAHNNIGIAYADSGRTDEAFASYDESIRLSPDYAEAHCNLALLLLLMEDYEHGWQEYEWRWQWKGFHAAAPNFKQPQWDGSPLAGRTLLLHAEQGLGDAVQFIRYAPLIPRDGGRVIVKCPPALARLLKGVAGIDLIVSGDRLPPFDVHVALMSLPRIFNTRVESIPAQMPYLQAEPELAKAWKTRLDRDASSSAEVPRRIGLAWAGDPNHKNDHKRSIPLSLLAPLAEVPYVNFYSLQKGPAAAQASALPEGMAMVDHTADLKDLADTAALISQLDLVITVDTVIAHLAGALGKPTWVLLPFWPDWRWMLDRADSPWYPTARLFRQATAGAWEDVIQQVVGALSEIA